jgi:hypothetical protein
MKREIPIILTMICGLLVTIAFFAPSPDAARNITPSIWQAINSELLEWAKVLVAVAFLLGIANVVRINLKQIAARHPDRWYKAVLLISMTGFLVIGMADIHKQGLWAPLVKLLVPADQITLKDGTLVEGYILTSTQTGLILRTGPDLLPREIPHAQIQSFVEPSLKMWIYFKIFSPLQATMFSLLAFYVASAAFRAFRARSVEATLLLVAGTIVLLGQVAVGDAITFGAAAPAKSFLMDYVLKAAERAIVIGAALGVLATGLRIVLGLERGYLSE